MTTRVDKAIDGLAEAYGGIENFQKEFNARVEESKKAWSAEPLNIGRILRSHLYVEHYVNKYLTMKYNFQEESINSLTFHQKLMAINNKNDAMRPLISSMKRFNRIRNMMSHNLQYSISKKDSVYFKSMKRFKSYMLFTTYTFIEDDPVDIYEVYSLFIAQNIIEALNPKQKHIDNVMKALAKDVADIYYDRPQQ